MSHIYVLTLYDFLARTESSVMLADSSMRLSNAADSLQSLRSENTNLQVRVLLHYIVAAILKSRHFRDVGTFGYSFLNSPRSQKIMKMVNK